MAESYGMTRTRDFIKLYGAGIVASIKGTGLFFAAVVAQSCLESDYGNKVPAGSNNFGGIKYNPNMAGVIGYVVADTTEYTKAGVKYRTQAKFAKFKDAAAGFTAHINVLLGDRYKAARLNATSPDEQILMIAKAGYTSTAPQKYLDSMKSIIRNVQDLTQFGRIS